MEIELTAKEQRAISALKEVARKWPKTLWLFSGSGTLQVMRKGKNGERVEDSWGCMDQEYAVGTIDIENDGGDY